MVSWSWFTTLPLCVAALTWRGADISSVPIVERAGVRYTDTNGSSGAFEALARAHGMNAARVRVWTTGDYNTAYALSFANRIKAQGMTLIVDLHFSDTWADPGHQSIPSGWGSTLDQLNPAIYNYTMNLVKQFNAQGTPIDILQLGNEINGGLLWPVGRTSSGWSAPSQLLHSARNGARDGGFSGRVLIHLADGWNQAGQTSWYRNIQQQGAFSLSDFDIMGVSFYPFYGTSATLASLQTTLNSLATTFGKPIVVAETDWPATSSCGSTSLSAGYPKSPDGQVQWSQAIINVLHAVPNGLGQGLFYWEPGWIGNANLGSSCADNLLVDNSGRLRSSIRYDYIFNNIQAYPTSVLGLN